jgi:methylmalonyl-CoA mutase cobalamin-binding subunit
VLSGEDRTAIQRKGVGATFGPGSDSAEIVEEIRRLAEGGGAA